MQAPTKNLRSEAGSSSILQDYTSPIAEGWVPTVMLTPLCSSEVTAIIRSSSFYVDVLMIGCCERSHADAIQDQFCKVLTLKSLGEAKYAIGPQIKYDRGKGVLLLNQSSCTTRIWRSTIMTTQHLLRICAEFGNRPSDILSHFRLFLTSAAYHNKFTEDAQHFSFSTVMEHTAMEEKCIQRCIAAASFRGPSAAPCAPSQRS